MNHKVLNANEDFVTFLTSELNFDDFTLVIESQKIAYLLGGSEHIYWIWTLKVKCTQYGFCEQVALKNARASFFFEGDNNFRLG